jgi:hemerythrin
MPLFEWKPVLSVNVESIDGQHQQLIALMNSFHEAHERQAYPVAIGHLKKLAAFTEQHFADEERLMAKAAYPGLAAHREHHKKLLTSVGRLAQEYIATPSAKSGEHLGKFLKSWLSGHILGVDKEYGPHLVSHGIH